MVHLKTISILLIRMQMFDGDHVRRQSIGSTINASPCVRVGKRRPPTVLHSAVSANSASLPPAVKPHAAEEKPSIASTSSIHSGGELLIKARHGLLEQQGLEESAPNASKEDFLSSGRFSLHLLIQTLIDLYSFSSTSCFHSAYLYWAFSFQHCYVKLFGR